MAFNGIKYIKNVTKSFGYAVIDVVGEMNPVVHSFTETNGDLGKELYTAVKDYKGTARKIKKNVLESDVYEFAKNYKKNLFEDLKTGKFYNKERMDEIAEKASGVDDDSWGSEFDDMFSDDDFGDWDEGTLKSDMFMARHIDDVGSKIAESNAEVTVRSAEYMANVQKETTKALYIQNNKLFGQALQGMAAINSNVGQLVGMPEIMQTHANNASTFFEKTSSQLDQITGLLDTLVKNTTPSDEEARRRADENPDISFRDIFTSKGAPNIKKYVEYAKKNLVNNTGELAMLGDLFGNGVSMLQTFAASPLESVMKAAVKQLIPSIVKSSMDNFNDTMQGFFGSALTKLNRADSYDNPVLGFIQKIFGINPDLKTDFDSSAYEKGKVAWDGVSRKALVEVIPGQLAKIASALTGEDPLVFNPDTGKMESIGRINDRANGRLQSAADFAGYDLRREINKVITNGKMRFKTKAEQDSWENDLDTFFMNIFQNGGLTREDMKEGKLISELSNSGNATMLAAILKDMSAKKKGKKILLDLNRRVLSGIDQHTAQMKNMEANGSVDNALFNGMFESFLERYNTDEARADRNATGISRVQEGRERSAFALQVDQFGHNIFYYLQGIFQRQDAIYENSSYMVDNWGAGNGSSSGSGLNRTASGIYLPRNIGRGSSRAASLREIEYNQDIISIARERADREKRNEEWHSQSLAREKEQDSEIIDKGISKSTIDEMLLNNSVAEYKEEYDKNHDDDNKTFIDKMLEQKDLKGKFGVLVNGTTSFLNKPLEGIAKMFDAASDNMYNLIYGEKPSDTLKDMGFIGVVKENIQGTFDKMNGWIDEHVLNPLKEKFGIENRDDFFTKLFDVFGKDYNEFKEKTKDGIFGKVEDGVRSGGLFGDYIQNVKDSAKSAFGWMGNGFKEVGGKIFGGEDSRALDHWTRGDVSTYATGGTVQKTGIAAVSKGELIIPSEMNPFYHGTTNKAQQIRDENQAVRNFFGSYAKGGHVKDQFDIDYVIEDVRNYVTNSGIDISDEELKKYLSQVMIDQKLQDSVDKNGNPISRLDQRVKYLTGKAKAYIKKKELTYRRKKLSGQKIKVVDYNPETGEYMTDDGFIGNSKNLKNGRRIVSNGDGSYSMHDRPESFLGDMVLNLAKAAKAVHHSFVDGSGKKGEDDQITVFDDVIDDVTGNFKSYAGAMTVGGGIGAAVSALTGMVGGPLVGAAVGSAVGLTMKSDKVQEWLFGKAGEDGREGGVFSKETSKFITEKVPTMAKFGMVGGAAGTILGHPMIGTLVGSAVGLAQKSETFGNVMFNGTDKDGNKHRGLLNMTQDEFNDKVKTKLPRIAAGAVAGALTTPLPFGFLPNIMLGAAIGFASDTEKFKTKLFGAVGKDGERHGGIVGAFREEIVKPLGDFIKDQTYGLKDWLENDIMKPMTGAVQPLAKQMGLFTKALLHPIKWLTGKRTKTNSFIQTIMGSRPMKAVKSITSNVTDAAISGVKGTLGFIPGLIGAAGDRARASQIAGGNADYMTAQERLDFRKEHSGGGFFKDLDGAMDTIDNGVTNMLTKGKRLTGVGQAIKGGAKIAGTLLGTPKYISRSVYDGVRDKGGDFEKADEWMANASVDEKKQIRDLLISASDAQKGKKEREKNLQRELDASIRSNTFSLLTPADRNKFIKKVKEDGNSPEDLRKFLLTCKTRTGAKITEQQADEIMSTIQDQLGELRRIQGLKEDKDLDAERKSALDQVKKVNGGQFSWMAKAITDKKKGNKNAEKLLSMLDYEIDMDDQVNEQESEEDKQADKEAKVEEKRDKQHNEVMDLIKTAINALSATAGIEQPYTGDGIKRFGKNDKVEKGSNEDLSSNNTNKEPNKSDNAVIDHGALSDKLNPDTLKEDTDTPEQQQEVPAAAFGGLVKKAGKAVLSAGEKVVSGVKNSGGVKNAIKSFIFGDNGEEEQSEDGGNQIVQTAKKSMASAGTQAPPVAGMFNSDATAAHVGDYLPGQKVWIADRRYKYDGESQELVPDNSAAKEYEANKKKAMANANGGSSGTTKPDEEEVKNASDDAKTLDSIFGSMGLGGIGKMLSGLKNLSWIPALAGPLALIGFLTGKLDKPISSMIQGIGDLLGWSQETKDNLTLSGEDGEDSYSGNAAKRAVKNTITTGVAHGISGFFKGAAKRFGKTATKEYGKKGLLHKIAGAAREVTGRASDDIANAFGSVENKYLSLVGKGNLKIMDAAAEGKFGKGAQKFASNFFDDNFKRDVWENAGKNADEAGSSILSKASGMFTRTKDLFSGKAVFDPISGTIMLPKAAKDPAKELAKDAAGSAKGIKGLIGKAKSGIKSALGGLKDQKQTDKLVKAVTDAADGGTDEAKKEATDKLKEWLVKLANEGKIDQKFAEHGDDLANEILKLGEDAGKNAAKKGTKKTFVGNLKSMGPIGWASTLAFAVTDFVSGYQDANTILGISDATTAEKVIAGLLKSIKGVIEGIIACVPGIGTILSIGLSMIPEKSIVTVFVNVFKDVLNPVKKLDEKRKAMTEKVQAYNSKTGKSYDTEQYLKTVNNDRTIFEKAGQELKIGFHNINAFFNGGEKTSISKVRNSGYDVDGNFIEGYLNKSTRRWKGYYAKAINAGKISAEYAEALYMNECLHDSSLNLDDARKADYEQRISEFKSANPSMTIPTITTDLKGLINRGSVTNASIFGIGIGGQKKGEVDYGGGKSSKDFVGSFATGGVIEKTGYAALSKGELRTTPSKISSILGTIFGKSKDDSNAQIGSIKDYDDLTDIGSFVQDIQSLDPGTTEWKNYWSKVDSSIKSKGILGTLKKTLYRMAATMFMPSFAMGKMLSAVNTSLDSSLGTGVVSSSAGSSSSTNSNMGKSVLSSTSSTTSNDSGKKDNIFTKALKSVGGFFGKLFGKGSGIYGGKSGMVSDGSFISQLDSNDQYGDSSYAEEGCAPATAAMLINQVAGGNMTMEDAGNYAVSRGYKVKGDGTKEGFFKDIFNSKGIASEDVGDSRAVLNNLKAGKPTIILGQDKDNKSKKYSPFGKNPHYVLATGVDKNGNIIVNDPESSRGGKRYKPGILSKMKSAISTKIAGGHSGLTKLYGGGDVKSQVWYYLTKNGFTEQAAAGLMGNLEQETHFNPALETSVTCGIACWDYQNGKSALKEAAAKAGVDWKDLGFQLDYLMKGLPNAFNSYTGKKPHYYDTGEWCWWPEKMTFDQFKQLTSINDACEIFERVYERASLPMIETRKQYANEIYKQFTGKEGEPITAGSYNTDGSSSDSSSDDSSGSILSGFDKLFNSALKSVYGENTLSGLKSAGLFSGFGDDEATTAETGGTSDSDDYSTTTATVTTADGANVSASTTIGQEVATDSANYIGNKYVWGGNSLDSGVDCSGFVQQLYKKHGYNIAQRNSKAQFLDKTHGTTITGGTYKDLKPGDAMYFSSNGSTDGIHHVGIYAGNGHMIHAQSTKTGIVDTDLATSEYYKKQYIGAKRFGSGSGMFGVSTVGDIISNTLKTSNTTSNNAKQPTVSGILSNTFKNSANTTNGSIQNARASALSNSANGFLSSLAKGSNGTSSMSNLIESIDRIAKLLQSIVDNTEPIAQICKLITGMNDDNKAEIKKREEAEKTTRKSMSVNSSSAKGAGESPNSSDILQLLTAFAQV